MTLDTAQLTAFSMVIREGTFEAAARALHITPSAVSQRIKALEQAVGQVLVRRTRPCLPTEAGQPLLRLAGQFALLEREALDAARGPVAGDPVRTRVAVVVNADSLATWFLPALRGLADRVVFDLREDDQDHTADLLRDGTVTAAVTAQNEPVQGCRVERLGAMRYIALAAPGVVPSLAALATVPALVFNRKDRLQHRFLRQVSRRRLDPPVHYIPATAAFNHAACLGMGWGMQPEQLAAPELAAGRLVDIAPGEYLDVPLYWQHWRIGSAVLSELTAAVRAEAAATLRT